MSRFGSVDRSIATPVTVVRFFVGCVTMENDGCEVQAGVGEPHPAVAGAVATGVVPAAACFTALTQSDALSMTTCTLILFFFRRSSRTCADFSDPTATAELAARARNAIAARQHV